MTNQTFEQLKKTYESGRTRPLAWRRAQLNALRRLVTENRDAFVSSAMADLGKPAAETVLMELNLVAGEAQFVRNRLSLWTARHPKAMHWMLQPAAGWTIAEPKGVVLIISPWNYPVLLALEPMADALAAGNAVCLKPSELSPNTSKLLAELVPQYLDSEAVRVGDTLTWASNPCPEPLPGYREAKPMVYTGLFPIDNKDYENLRDALDKLHVNDPSLVWEPETSVALGFGFRVGFLGLLHMEVVKERLEREFNLDLIATSPSVDYHVYKTDGEMIDVRSPQDLPEATRIERIEEPYLKAKIICPPEYTGAVMQLAIEHRGVTTDMIHLTSKSVEMRFDMPLAELILDFFDQLKSRTKGYASLDYEFNEYRPSELVKLDILLSGDEVDALSFIVHKDKAYGLARGLCDKLKEIIPRQLFEVPIQGAIGNKIIARSTVKARRKDVLAKCYGGDISRKRKLLEKQKEGKKRMKAIGSVEVPQEAFMAILKVDE